MPHDGDGAMRVMKFTVPEDSLDELADIALALDCQFKSERQANDEEVADYAEWFACPA